MDVDARIEETKRLLSATYRELSGMLADRALPAARRALILSRIETLRDRRAAAVLRMRDGAKGKEDGDGGRPERRSETRHGEPVA